MLPQISETVQIASVVTITAVLIVSLTVVGGVSATPITDDGINVDEPIDTPNTDENSDTVSIQDNSSNGSSEADADTSLTKSDSDISTSTARKTTSTSTTPHDSCSVNFPYVFCFPPGPILFVGNCLPGGDHVVQYGACAAYSDGTRLASVVVTVGAVDANHGNNVSVGGSFDCGGDSGNEAMFNIFPYISPSDQDIGRIVAVDDPFEIANDCTP